MPLFDAGDCFSYALETRSLPSNAKDESIVNTGENV